MAVNNPTNDTTSYER